jgi:hypothetical protein
MKTLLILALTFATAAMAAPTPSVTEVDNVGKVRVERTDLGVPQKMNVQGYLEDTLRNKIHGSVPMSFRVFDAQSGGTQLWSKDTTVVVDSGLFSLGLPAPASVFLPGANRWMEMLVSGVVLTPRVEMTSVGFAYRSIKSDTATVLLGGVQYADSAGGARRVGGYDVAGLRGLFIYDGQSAGGDLAGAYPDPSIRADAVSTAMIQDSAISAAKLSGSSVTLPKIDPTGSSAGQTVTSTGSGSPPSWSNPTPGPHNHLGESWSSTSANLGLALKLDRNTSDAICGRADTILNSGSGSVTAASIFTAGMGTGDRVGVRCYAQNPYGVNTTGGSFDAFGGSSVLGLRAAGTLMGSSGGSVTGVIGTAQNSSTGSGSAIAGTFNAMVDLGAGMAQGVYTHATANDGTAYGLYSQASSDHGPVYAIYALKLGGGNYAGYFDGNVHVNGTLTKSSGSFLIDHPLDPLNKTLRHNFVESPENLCLYRGKVRLGADGSATVSMPSYFVALTKEAEATAVLTSVGRPFATGYQWSSGFDRITVYGDAGREVSYIVLADRDDPVMRQLYRPPEEEKGNGNFTRGKLLCPAAYGYPDEAGVDYELRMGSERERQKWQGN